MSVVMIDGPQGSGKTTLCQYYVSHVDPSPLHRKFDSINLPYISTVKNDKITYSNIIYERGWLSTSIYGFLWESELELSIDRHGHPTVHYHPVHKGHITAMMDELDHLIILYADDPLVLHNRIGERTKETGRELTELEHSVVTWSNALFNAHGTILKEMYPSKVTLIECTTPLDKIKNVLDNITK